MYLKYAPRQALLWLFLVPNHRPTRPLASFQPQFPACQGLGTTGLPSKSSTSHEPGPLGGIATRKCLTTRSSWRDRRHSVREQAGEDRSFSWACGRHFGRTPGCKIDLSPLHFVPWRKVGSPGLYFLGVCMLEGRPPSSHPTKGETAESGKMKRKLPSQGPGRLKSSSGDQASARGMGSGARHFRPFPSYAVGLQPDPSCPQAQHRTSEGEPMTIY